MADIVINDETFPGVASVTLNSTTDTATFLSTDYVLVGTPEVAETAADMTETDKIYVYVGSETGYTAGNWYYFNGTSWESGGVYGSSGGGISNNARNLLKYVLQRVAYTETGMEVYVNALYQALAETSGGGTTYDYVIANALVNVTSNNSASGINDGDSYTATLTADSGATMDSVTVYMDDEDITSTAYNSSTGVVSIASATGDIIIIATATAPVTSYTITNALSHITNSNSASSITSGDSYSATLTADTDYYMGSVIITMGGIDITSTAYDSSDNSITISSVTGDIVITATAVEIGIPTGYTEVAYITADQTGSTKDGSSRWKATEYIDTGITITAEDWTTTMKIEASLYFLPDYVTKTTYMRNGASGALNFGGIIENNRAPRYWCSPSTAKIDVQVPTDGTFSEISTEIDLSTRAWTFSIDGGTAYTGTGSIATIYGRNVIIGAFWDAANNLMHQPMWCQWKYYKVYNGSTLVASLVPCVRDSDGKAGMYDVVRRQFYPSSGSADFTYTALS